MQSPVWCWVYHSCIHNWELMYLRKHHVLWRVLCQRVVMQPWVYVWELIDVCVQWKSISQVNESQIHTLFIILTSSRWSATNDTVIITSLSHLFFSLLRIWQPCRGSRTWSRRRAGFLPAPFLLLPPHLPPRPMPAERCWLCVLPARSQSGGDAKWQPIISDRTLLPPPAGARRRRPALPAQRQLQLRKPERWAADPSGAAPGSAAASADDHQPGDSELEGQRSSGGAQSGVNTALDTGTCDSMFSLLTHKC